jgi:hypothetical protein
MATDWSGLLPEAVAASILSATEEESVVLGLAATRPMAAGVESVPLLSVAPEAAFIGRGERKPQATIEGRPARRSQPATRRRCAHPDVRTEYAPARR